jgi:hypothetical protein
VVFAFWEYGNGGKRPGDHNFSIGSGNTENSDLCLQVGVGDHCGSIAEDWDCGTSTGISRIAMFGVPEMFSVRTGTRTGVCRRRIAVWISEVWESDYVGQDCGMEDLKGE